MPVPFYVLQARNRRDQPIAFGVRFIPSEYAGRASSSGQTKARVTVTIDQQASARLGSMHFAAPASNGPWLVEARQVVRPSSAQR
jgi:hypothetical protein